MNKQIKKSISLFLLALVLTTQVGLHFLHHHSASHSTLDQVTLHDDHDHCAVCSLDLFIAQDLPAEFSFSFSLQHEEKWIAPASSEVYCYIVFTSGRAPPQC